MKVRIARCVFFGSVALLWGCTDRHDASTDPTTSVASRPLAEAIGLGATPLAVDPRGVPSLLRAGDAMPAMPAASATATARLHVERLAPAWGVRSDAMPTLEPLGEVPVAGGTIVRLRQVIDGMPVESTAGGELRVMVRSNGSLVGASGRLIATDTPHVATMSFVDDDAGAVARAVNATYKTTALKTTAFAPAKLAMAKLASDGSRMLSGQSGSVNVSLSRARKAWVPSGKSLVPAWIVEAYSSDMTSTNGDAYRTVIAADGRVMSRTNLKADAGFKYRVFAESSGEFHPFDSPLVDSTPNVTGVPFTTPYPGFVPPNLVTVDGLNNLHDSWLDPTANLTQGNNVDAYLDANAPDGLSAGDFRATATAAGQFDRTYNTAAGAAVSTDQQMAGITSLFYIINFMHDFWYDGGFTEAAGNGQNSNLGRGGEERDAMLAETQDSSGRDNANMSTPSDGFPGKMQVFLWDGKADRSLTIPGRTAPILVASESFGPATFDVTAAVVLAVDGTAPTTDACEPLTAPVTGKIVLVDRGLCTAKAKVLNVQNAGGVGVIIANNALSVAPPGFADDMAITTPITIGILSVLQSEGDTIKTALGAGTVTATLHRGASGPDLEGTLDASVVGHEFGHFVHHRLSVCNTALCGAMSEGWADFSALLLVSRAGDDLDRPYPMGIYSTMSFAADPVYFGIRRAPYSANQAINPLHYHHMTAGVDLPPPPFNGGPTALNNEVHNAGEVWASMLWDGYVALQKAGPSFEDVRLRMRKYVVAGLLLAPPDATPTETRDALLMAVKAASPADHDILLNAFTKRGFGSCAVSPDRFSASFAGIVDSDAVQGRIATGEPALAGTTSCDNDEALDGGETLQVQIPITNPGPVALNGVTATLSSSLPGVSIDKPTVMIGKIDPDGSAMATFSISLDNTLKAPTISDFSVAISSTDGCGTVNVPILVRLNTDDSPDSSATDNFDAGTSVWTATHVPQGPADTAELWSHIRLNPLNGQWLGADPDGPSDASVVSPELKAGADPVTVTIMHAFGFEFAPADGSDPEADFDGGVIELTTDGGKTWNDISTVADPGYNKTMFAGTPGAPSVNPLAGRRAFGGLNAQFPNLEPVTLNIGTKLANQTFQLRFRVGSDTNTGSAGWLIDSVAFTGIVGKPFPTLVADKGNCAGVDHPKIVDDGGCCQAGGMAGGNLAAALGVLAMLVRRRRRRS